MDDKVFWEGGTMLSPLPPAMVSCGTMENPNILTIGWTGIINTKPPMTYISVRPERHSFNIIKESGEFVINLPTEKLAFACDWCGVKSGRDVDKFKEMGLTPVKGERVNAPIIKESPVNIECRVVSQTHLGTHDMFMAEIIGVNVSRELLDENGRLCLDKAGLIAYAHGTYYTLGRSLGTFGYSVKKKVNPKKLKARKRK